MLFKGQILRYLVITLYCRLVHEEQTEIGRDIQKETRDETGSTGDSVGTNLNAESEKKKKDESSMVNTKNDIPGSFEKKRNEQELTHLSSGEVAGKWC